MRERLILIVFIISVGLVITSCQKSAEEHFTKALDYQKIKDYKSAVEELNSAIEKNPNFAKAYLERGRIRFTLDYKRVMENLISSDEAYKLSIKDFTKAIELDKNYNEDVLIGRGFAYVSIKNYKMALEDFEEVLERDSSNKQAIANIVMCKVQLKEIDGAKIFLDRIIAMNPNDAVNYYGRATYRLTSFNDKTGGCEDLKRAQELYSTSQKYLANNLKEEIEKLIKINCKK
jgi:tetratricopeptide (TPR) repeat protein